MSFFPIALVHVLAQATQAGPAASPGDTRMKLFYELAILMAIVIVGGVFLLIMRRKLTTPMSAGQDVGFSLSSLREMRDRGEITPEEYEATRAKVIAKTKSAAQPMPKPKPRLEDE